MTPLGLPVVPDCGEEGRRAGEQRDDNVAAKLGGWGGGGGGWGRRKRRGKMRNMR